METDQGRPGEMLLQWYERNGRDLPWKHSKDPYSVLVSEVMLQQTRAETVRSRFGRFMARFPTVKDLAWAGEDAVLKEWEGLGYYSRARNLHKAAKYILEVHGGEVPPTAAELVKVPGIGPYTAGAVSAIAFNQPEIAVDANVVRVMSRVLTLEEPASSGKARRRIEEETRSWLTADAPGDFAQAMMDLGAGVCTARNPQCGACPVSGFCRAFSAGTQEKYPARTSKKERRQESITVFCITDGASMAFVRRPEGGLLSSMYAPPSVEGALEEDEAARFAKDAGLNVLSVREGPAWQHTFTHVQWTLQSYIICVAGSRCAPQFLFADSETIQKDLGVPSAFRPAVQAFVDAKF